jgi:hypothetical protein
VTASGRRAVAVLPSAILHSTHLNLLNLLCLHLSLSGNGFQRWTFPLLWLPEMRLCLSYQLLRATAQTTNPSGYLTNPVSLIVLLIISQHRLHRKNRSSVFVCGPLPSNDRYTVAYLVRERMVKTQQAGKGLADAVVICKLWRSAIELQTPLIPSYVNATDPHLAVVTHINHDNTCIQ